MFNTFIKIWDIVLTDEVGSVLLESAVKMCPKLFNVQLFRVEIGLKTWISIKEAFSTKGCKIQYLDISCNRLNDEWFWEVMTGISKNRSLKGLVFWRNSITPYSMKVVNVMLKYITHSLVIILLIIIEIRNILLIFFITQNWFKYL